MTPARRCGAEDGTVAWARPWDRPWWPAVLFSSWDAARNWTPPAGRTKIRVLGRPEPLQDTRPRLPPRRRLAQSLRQAGRTRCKIGTRPPEAVLATTLSNRHCDRMTTNLMMGRRRTGSAAEGLCARCSRKRLALPLCGRAPDAARRFVDNTPRRGRWPAKKKSRVKRCTAA